MGTGLSWWLRMKGEDSYGGSIPKGESQESPTLPPLPCPSTLGWPTGAGLSKLQPEGQIQPATCFYEYSFIGTQPPPLYSLWLPSHRHSRTDWLQQRLCDPQSLEDLLPDLLQKRFADTWTQGILSLRQQGCSWGRWKVNHVLSAVGLFGSCALSGGEG